MAKTMNASGNADALLHLRPPKRKHAPDEEEERHDRNPRLLRNVPERVKEEAADERPCAVDRGRAFIRPPPPKVAPQKEEAEAEHEPRVLGLGFRVHPLEAPPIEE